MASNLKQWHNGAWVENPNMKQWHNGAWVDANLWQQHNGVWTPAITRTAATTQYSTTWTSTSGVTYVGDGTKKGSDLSNCYQGYYSSNNGQHTSMFFFNYADIQAKLAGSVINDVNITVGPCNWAYWPGDPGCTFYLGMHNQATVPTTYSSVYTKMCDITMNRGDPATTKDMTNLFGERFRDNVGKGIVLDANSTNVDYYGFVSNVIKINILYTK